MRMRSGFLWAKSLFILMLAGMVIFISSGSVFGAQLGRMSERIVGAQPPLLNLPRINYIPSTSTGTPTEPETPTTTVTSTPESSTDTVTPTETPLMPTDTATATETATATATLTPEFFTDTVTPTETSLPPTDTATATETATATATLTPEFFTDTVTPTETSLPPTDTATATETATATATLTPEFFTDTVTPTETPLPPTDTATATETVTTTATLTPEFFKDTVTPTETSLPPSDTATATETSTSTPTPVAATDTVTPTETLLPPTDTATATETSTATPTLTPEFFTDTVTPTETLLPPTNTATATETSTSTLTPTPNATWSAPAGNIISDPSFEVDGVLDWSEQSSTNFGSPWCSPLICGNRSTSGPHSGSGWVWLGGTNRDELATIAQNVVISKRTATLEFYLWIGQAPAGSDADDVFKLLIDNKTIFTASALDQTAYNTWQLIRQDVTPYADGKSHNIKFSVATTGQAVSFNLDDVSLTTISNGYNISGSAGASGVSLTYTVDGIARTAMSDVNGNYIFTVPAGWTGSVTPSKTDYSFTPSVRSYAIPLNSNQTLQNFTSTAPTSTPTVTVTKTATPTPTATFTVTSTKTKTPTAIPNQVKDPGFELATSSWTPATTNAAIKQLCKIAFCGNRTTAKPRTGLGWVWLGGASGNLTASITQSVPFPVGVKTLEFYLWIGYAGAGSDSNDKLTVTIDGTSVFTANATQKSTYPGYVKKIVNVTKWANGKPHVLKFTSVTTLQTVNFNLDDISVK